MLDMRSEASVAVAFEAIGAFDHLVVTAGPRQKALAERAALPGSTPAQAIEHVPTSSKAENGD